jgi:putative transcriptional regulator
MREPESSPESLAGSILLAHPILRDPNFRRTVVLISNHDRNGAMGVVLNRPLNRKMAEFGADFALGPLAHVPVFDGGPVEKRQIILCAWCPHEDQDAEGLQLMFGVDRERAEELVTQDGVSVRAFVGYSGWSAGQLEGELARDTWVVSDLDPDAADLPPDESLWRHLLGGIDARWRLLAGEPDEPERN